MVVWTIRDGMLEADKQRWARLGRMSEVRRINDRYGHIGRAAKEERDAAALLPPDSAAEGAAEEAT